MRVGGRRPGTSTSFIDAASDEVLFHILGDDDGSTLIFFNLYDSLGSLVATSDGLRRFPEGAEIRCAAAELLLQIPPNADSNGNIQYKIYNRQGDLLACSDGTRTQIYRSLRLEGNKRLPAATTT